MAISNSNMTIDKPNQFPWKLYDMLDAAEKRNEQHIISWIRDGKAFKVHNRELFIEEYMKKMFNQTKFKSFQRQLNLWGFERVQNGPDKGCYFHPLFVQGNRDCCQRLTRMRLKGVGGRTSRHDDDSSLQPESPASVAASASASTAAFIRARPGEEIRVGAAASPSGAAPVAAAASGAVAARLATSDAMDAARRRREAVVAAAAEMSRMPLSLIEVEPNLQLNSQQSRLAELQQYQSHDRNPSIIDATLAGSRSNVSLVIGAPIYASADSSNLVVNGLLQQEYENHHLQQQQQQQQQEQQQHRQRLQQLQDDRQSQEQQPPQNEGQQEGGQQPRGESGSHRPVSDQLAALLSVSAQRRREEELALLLALANGGGGRVGS